MNSFNVFLSSDLNKKGYISTFFTSELSDRSLHYDNYEVGLAQISFTNTATIDFGYLHFNSYTNAEKEVKKHDIKIEAKTGESYASVFEKLNSQIEKIFEINEFKRREYLRSMNFIKENEIYYDDIKSGIQHKIILPLKNNNALDECVLEQIRLIKPEIKLEYYKDVKQEMRFTLLHKLGCLHYTITYSGNIVNTFPELNKKVFNEISGGPQHVIFDSEYAPDFSLLFIETDLIENRRWGVENKILKFFETKNQSTPQLIDFSNFIEYKQLKYKESNEFDAMNHKNANIPLDYNHPKSINISFKDRNFKNIYLNQGSIIVNLHFRKK